MSGRKGMRHFGSLLIEEVLNLRSQGKTQREIAELFQLRNKKAVSNLLNRHRIQQEKQAQGVLPKKKGRPRKDEKSESLEQKVTRLERENDLLRSFLQRVGRR